MEKSNFFSYAGFHFKLCTLELRELFAHIFESKTFADTVRRHLPGVHEFVPLYTCNRFDMCLFGEADRESVSNLFWELAMQALPKNKKFTHISVCPSNLKEHISESLRFVCDKEGLILFLSVASSLDSLVLGETQILGQMKNAYSLAKKRAFADKYATRVFDHCFKVSKRIRTETALFKNVISIGHLAVEFAQKEFEDITNKKIVIFGAGEIAVLTAKHFIYHNAKQIFIANRTLKNAERVCEKLEHGTPISLSNAQKTISNFDICIAACGGENLILTQAHFQDYARTRNGQRALFIDISVPRKIEPSLPSFHTNVKLFNIDELGAIVEQNKTIRRNELQKAEDIILNETNVFLDQKLKRESVREITHFNSWLSGVVQKEVDRFLAQKSKNKTIESSVIARSICKKVNVKMRQKVGFLD